MWKFRNKPEYVLLGGYVGAMALGLGVYEFTMAKWPVGEGSFAESIGPPERPILAGAMLLVVVLQSALLAWRFERFPVVIWGILGSLHQPIQLGFGALVGELLYRKFTPSESSLELVRLYVDLVQHLAPLLIVVLEAYFLAAIFKRPQMWLYISLVVTVVYLAQSLLWFMKVEMPDIISHWIVPLLASGAAGLWLATEDLVDDPIEPATESPG